MADDEISEEVAGAVAGAMDSSGAGPGPSSDAPLCGEIDQQRFGGQAWRAALTHCPAGHPYEGENLYVSPAGARGCRRCRHDQKIASKKRLRSVAAVQSGRSGEQAT